MFLVLPMDPHHSPSRSTSSGSIRKAIPAYRYSYIIMSCIRNHLKKTSVKLIGDRPVYLDMRSTHLLIRGTHRSVGSCEILLGSYNTSDSPITIVIVSLIVIVVPLLSPYCYYCAP